MGAVSGDLCRICGSANGQRLSRETQRYFRCRACHAITMLISADDYQALNPQYDAGPSVALRDPAALREFLAVDEKRGLLKRFFPRTRTSRRFLDIGSGAGGYLLAARELGCEVLGVEPSNDHAHIARDILGLPVVDGYFSASRFEPNSFDLVLMSHVIEHIYEPAPFLKEAMGVVAPGGRLVVVTPNAASLIAVLSGSDWAMLAAPDHVSMMSEESFRRAGINDLGLCTFSQSEYPWEFAASALQIVRARWRARRTIAVKDVNAPPPTPTLRWRRNLSFLRAALTVVSAPVHWACQLTRREACLVVSVEKPLT